MLIQCINRKERKWAFALELVQCIFKIGCLDEELPTEKPKQKFWKVKERGREDEWAELHENKAKERDRMTY